MSWSSFVSLVNVISGMALIFAVIWAWEYRDLWMPKLKGKNLGEGYRRILWRIFHYDNRVPGADRKTFEAFPNTWFARDKNRVYSAGIPVKDADAKSFQPIKLAYGRDKFHVIWGVKIMKYIDPQTFGVIGDYYTKDRGGVYWKGKPLPGCDKNSFEILEPKRSSASIGRDNTGVFFEDKRIAGADPKSFNTEETLGKYYFSDKNAVYYKTLRLEHADRNSFSVNIFFAKAFSFCEIYNITGDDRNQIEAGDFAIDKNNIFFRGEIIGQRNQSVEEILAREDDY